MQEGQLAGWGFHAGDLAVQERAGVRADAERLIGMRGHVFLNCPW